MLERTLPLLLLEKDVDEEEEEEEEEELYPIAKKGAIFAATETF